MFAWSPQVGWASKGRSKVGRVLSTANLRRKLVVLAWHILCKGEDYAFARPSLVREKIRRLELLTRKPRDEEECGRRTGARISWAVKRPSSAAGDSPSSEAKNDSPTQEMNAWRIRPAAPPPSVTATL